jgi:hypothetical protein
LPGFFAKHALAVSLVSAAVVTIGILYWVFFDADAATKRIVIAFSAGWGGGAWVLAVRALPTEGFRQSTGRVLLGVVVCAVGFVLALWLLPKLSDELALPVLIVGLFLGNLGLSQLFWANPWVSLSDVRESATALWARLRKKTPG